MIPATGYDQLPVINSPKAQDAVGKIPDLSTAAFHYYDFQAIVMIQVYVHRRKHFTAKLMLRLHKFLSEIRPVVVVDDGQSSDDGPILVDLHVH